MKNKILINQYSSKLYNSQLTKLKSQLQSLVDQSKEKQTQTGLKITETEVKKILFKIVELNNKAHEKGKFNSFLSSTFQTYIAVNNESYTNVLAYLLPKSEERNYFIKMFHAKRLEELLNHY